MIRKHLVLNRLTLDAGTVEAESAEEAFLIYLQHKAEPGLVTQETLDAHEAGNYIIIVTLDLPTLFTYNYEYGDWELNRAVEPITLMPH